jgi:exodeoxyribonuclease VIII
VSAAQTIPGASVLDLPPGLYRDVSEADYHARVPGLVSKSVLDLVDRSPAHYSAWLHCAEREPTPALIFGKWLHTALLEPERFAAQYIAQPDFGDCRLKDNKARRSEWQLANAGKESVDAKSMDIIRGICASVNAHPLAGKMIREGVAEATLRWRDEETGLQCKARADYYVERLAACYDVKTTEDARPDAFARSMANYRYHVQDAFYREGFARIGRPLDHFVFIAVEKTAPFEVALYTLDADDVARGWSAAHANMATLKAAVSSGTYQGYGNSIQSIRLPAWARR